MNGGEILRTCGKCGRLVFDAEQSSSQEFQTAITRFKDPKQKRLFRRRDGKLMLRTCGLDPDFSWSPKMLIFTGPIALVFLLLPFPHLMVPWYYFAVLYAWNTLGAVIVAFNMLHPFRRNAIAVATVLPLGVLEIALIQNMILYAWWQPWH